jgi:predicted RNA-binding Zn ribbon-like protein
LALEFINTHYAVRGALRDGLSGPEELAWWLWSCRERFATGLPAEVLAAIGPADVVGFQQLRDAARRLVDARVRGEAPDQRDIAQVNRAGGLGRSWPVLLWPTGGRPVAGRAGAESPLMECQAELAHEVIALLSNGATDIKPCLAPGCVLFFERTPPRREWCSTGCGNRARAARHYHRHHQSPVDLNP